MKHSQKNTENTIISLLIGSKMVLTVSMVCMGSEESKILLVSTSLSPESLMVFSSDPVAGFVKPLPAHGLLLACADFFDRRAM